MRRKIIEMQMNDKEAIRKAKAIHGDNYHYEVRIGSIVNLTKLKDNQRVCSAGIKGHHILMTEKQTPDEDINRNACRGCGWPISDNETYCEECLNEED